MWKFSWCRLHHQDLFTNFQPVKAWGTVCFDLYSSEWRHSWSYCLSVNIWNVFYQMNRLWPQTVFMATFPVGAHVCDSVLTSDQAGASHIYLSLAPLNSDGGRKSRMLRWNKSFIIMSAQTLLSLWGTLIFRFICWLHVRIMGFYRSTERLNENFAAAWLLPLEENWLCRCALIWAMLCILHGLVSHWCIRWVICWEINIRNLLQNPNVSFGRNIFSTVKRFVSACQTNS